MAKLLDWMAGKDMTPTVNAITRRVASDYLLDQFRGVHPRTAAKDLSAITSLWKHLEARGLASDNPWRGQSGNLPRSVNGQPGARGGARKRPFTNQELARLLGAAVEGTTLGDAIRLLALTGMRTEELARMKVSALKLTGKVPYVALRGAKTEAARRDVPLHAKALPILSRRIVGKANDQFVFEELPTPKEGSAMERGQPLTKAFGRLRGKLGITEREPGARQDNLDLHGLRRWAIASMRDALNRGAQGFTMRTVAQIVGHDTGDLGLSMTAQYAGEEPLEAKAAAIGAITLP